MDGRSDPGEGSKVLGGGPWRSLITHRSRTTPVVRGESRCVWLGRNVVLRRPRVLISGTVLSFTPKGRIFVSRFQRCTLSLVKSNRFQSRLSFTYTIRRGPSHSLCPVPPSSSAHPLSTLVFCCLLSFMSDFVSLQKIGTKWPTQLRPNVNFSISTTVLTISVGGWSRKRVWICVFFVLFFIFVVLIGEVKTEENFMFSQCRPIIVVVRVSYLDPIHCSFSVSFTCLFTSIDGTILRKM